MANDNIKINMRAMIQGEKTWHFRYQYDIDIDTNLNMADITDIDTDI